MLLAIDTCGATGGIALGTVGISTSQKRDSLPSSGSAPEHPDHWFRELAGGTYSELLLATISDVLVEAGVELEQLSTVAVVHGPGSFTGIRIGVSAAKGLAEGLGIPLIAISRLELLARKAPESSGVAILDAGRGDFFAGVYRGGVREREALLNRSELLATIRDAELPVLACEQHVLAAITDLGVKLVSPPTAIEVLEVGAERFQAKGFVDTETLDANYLRRSDAEMLAKIAEHAAAKAARLRGPSDSLPSAAEAASSPRSSRRG
jgi:tRNA threonylcarbamoyladenosine biosynthesis protein TsaB